MSTRFVGHATRPAPTHRAEPDVAAPGTGVRGRAPGRAGRSGRRPSRALVPEARDDQPGEREQDHERGEEAAGDLVEGALPLRRRRAAQGFTGYFRFFLTTLNEAWAGESSCSQAASVARTSNVCLPSLALSFSGDAQSSNGFLSRRHSKLEPFRW